MVSFIYFDLGGVVIEDFSGTNKWEELKRHLGITPDQDSEFDDFFDEVEPKVCVGMGVEKLVCQIEEKFKLKLPENYSLLDDFVNRFRKNTSIWPVITEVKKHVDVGLLTNMYPGMYRAIEESNLLPAITWDVIVDSSVEKIAKPDPKIYALSEQRCGHRGKDILFVENSKTNVQAAADFGWQTFWYDPSDRQGSSEELLTVIKSS